MPANGLVQVSVSEPWAWLADQNVGDVSFQLRGQGVVEIIVVTGNAAAAPAGGEYGPKFRATEGYIDFSVSKVFPHITGNFRLAVKKIDGPSVELWRSHA